MFIAALFKIANIWKLPKSVCMHAQSYSVVCNPMDCSLQGSSVHGIFQIRILEWVAIPFSKGESSWSKDRIQVSCIIGSFFTMWATREAQYVEGKIQN